MLQYGESWFLLAQPSGLHIMKRGKRETQTMLALTKDFIRMGKSRINNGDLRGIILNEKPKQAILSKMHSPERQLNKP